MLKKLFTWWSEWRIKYIRSKYKHYQRIIVRNRPRHVWQDMKSGRFCVGSEEAYAEIYRDHQYLKIQERIIGIACFDHKTELIFTAPYPYRHFHLVWACKAVGLKKGCSDQGFMTNYGRYVRRVEALRIAIAAGQLIRKTGNEKRLFSEDLWDIPETINIYKPKNLRKENKNDSNRSGRSTRTAPEILFEGETGLSQHPQPPARTPSQEDTFA